MQGPSKIKKGKHESQLQEQGMVRAASTEKVSNAVQPHFLALSKQNATNALKGRANADGAQQLNALLQGTSDIQQKQNMQSAGVNSLSGSAVNAEARAFSDRDGKMINALNVGSNQQATALSGTSALARMQGGEQNAALQRRVQHRADNLGALTAVGTGLVSAWGSNNGIFADGTIQTDGSTSGRGILGGYGSGNNTAVDSFDKKMADYIASQNA